MKRSMAGVNVDIAEDFRVHAVHSLNDAVPVQIGDLLAHRDMC